MINQDFRVLLVDLATSRARVITLEGRDAVAGGSGLAAVLFGKYGHPDRPWSDPEQPLIFAVGPLTAYFPLMSKTVCAFKSPYHDQYAESHAGGRSAIALRFAQYDALVITGRARRPSCVVVGMASPSCVASRASLIVSGLPALCCAPPKTTLNATPLPLTSSLG